MKALADKIRRATRRTMVAVAPDRYAPTCDEPMPDVVLAETQRQTDGTYRLVPFEERMQRVDARLMKLLGLDGQRDTLERLGRAGFVELVKAAPRTTLLNLDSYYNHLRRVAEDDEFWDPGRGNLEEYRTAL